MFSDAVGTVRNSCHICMKLLASELLAYTGVALIKAMKAGELIEVSSDG